MYAILFSISFVLGLQPIDDAPKVTPSPIDNFKANHAAIKANLDFEYTTGFADESYLDRSQVWKKSQRSFAAKPEQTIQGRWEFDGSTIHIIRRVPPEIWGKRVRPLTAEQLQAYTIPMECLYGESISAHHDFPYFPGHNVNQGIQVFSRDVPPNVSTGDGPFCWSGLFPLDHIIDQKFAALGSHSRKPGVTNDLKTINDFYFIDNTEGWVMLQINFDPSIGYLPRYARTLSVFKGTAFIVELFMLDASPCNTGGFVSTEWYQAFYQIRSFDTKYPDFRDHVDTKISGVDDKVSVYHFLGSNFESRTEPTTLNQLDGMKAIVGEGGVVPLGANVTSLTIRDLKNASVTQPDSDINLPAPSNIDHDELLKFTPKRPDSGSFSPLYVVVPVFIASILGFLWTRIKAKQKAVLLFLFSSSIMGCSNPSNPSVFEAGKGDIQLFP